MGEFQLALMIGAAVTALICMVAGKHRGLVWIATGVASFVVSTWYSRHGWVYPAAITALCDATVCLVVYFSVKEQWEKYLFFLFQGSVLTSILYFVEVIGPHWAYIAVLEAINWLALLLIGTSAISEWLRDARGFSGRLSAHLLGAHRLVWSHRAAPARR